WWMPVGADLSRPSPIYRPRGLFRKSPLSVPVTGFICQKPLSALEKPAGHVLEFDAVHFQYSPDENEVLRNISFTVSPGKRVAIVGASGAGKSTIVNLVLRFWDPTAGVIRLDGQDIQQYALADLRRVVGVVAQDTYLFNDTIRGNLLLARHDASDSDIEQALDQAQLSDFVRKLPRGLGTWVGEQGLRLSGGERQRLAIARTLLKNPPLLILDEATANLDPITERDLLAALDILMQGRTTLIITHRLIDMERMDEILVLDEGQIRERGTHEQLLKAEGLYHHMLDMLYSVCYEKPVLTCHSERSEESLIPGESQRRPIDSSLRSE
ncbi:MAG TPA: ATP-binding cassette domain-containing protein, partial [Ktedonobacteraceae bacterium]|nr:ATP-binding cassette domain-containing protein [Ktedonobacteraceae bacterium]